MPNKEDNTDQTQEQEAQNQAESNATADDVRIVEAMKPSSAPSPKKPLRYGTRRGRPGAKAPAVIPISSISKELVEEEIEMDDLPVKANAPDHLIDTNNNPSENRRDDGDDRRRRSDRPRGERRRRDDRERKPEARRSPERDTIETKPEDQPAAATAEPSEESLQADRPARFGMVSPTEARARAGGQVKEFRPSRDGRTSERAETGPEKRRSSRPRNPAKKTSFLSKVIAFFTGEPKEETTATRPTKPRQDRNRRAPQDRMPGDEGDERRRKRRPRNRNRKPRPTGADGENEPRSQNSEGGQRRRRRRPRRDGRQGGEGRERGRRDQERTPSSQ